jgi:signal transduction histidine kinase
MSQLIDDLLSFSRMGRAQLEEQTVDLDILLHDVIKRLEPSFLGRDIRWSLDSLPKVRGDPAMLKQVLVNLLSNAVKYTRNRPVAEIAVRWKALADGQIEVFVRDNGAGFDMRYADKLFGVFQRLHRADEFEGTGIGLANVRRIIIRHGGKIWADAKPNVGATFYFTLHLPRTSAVQEVAVP